MKRIAIFASGNGSNAENIIRYFQESPCPVATVAVVICNNPGAGVIGRCNRLGVEVEILGREEFNDPVRLAGVLESRSVDAIVLAGFLLMLPAFLTARYHDRVINIHPSLLPKFGGKGMYGRHVHKAVAAAGERETGITVHLVNERYDDGRIIFQAATPLEPGATPEEIEDKVHALERRHFPEVVAEWVSGLG